MKNNNLVKATILFCSMMTVMAGATIAPSLPEMKAAFPNNPSAETLVKLILTLPGLFIALSSPFSGYIIDKFGRIKLLVVSLLLYAIAGTSGLYLDTLFQIIIGRALLGTAVGGIMTVAVTLIGDYFEGEERKKFLGIQASVMSIAGTLFLGAGGLLADIGWRYPFAIYILALPVVPLVIKYLKEPENSGDSENAMKKVAIPRVAWIVYIISFLGMTVFYMMPVQVPFFIESIDSSISNGAVGLTLALTMLVAAFVSFNYQHVKKRFSYFQIYGMAFLIMGLGYLAVSYTDSYYWIFPGLFMAGAGAGLVMPNSNLLLVSISEPESRGRLLGLLTMFFFLGQFLSPLMFQPLIDFTSISEGFFYLSLAMILFAVIALIRNKRLAKT